MTNSDRRVLAGRVVRYGLAGLLATAIYSGVVVLLVEVVHTNAVPASVIATVVVMISSYVVNRRFVFDTDRPHASSFPRFAIATLVSIALNAGIMHLATGILGWRYVFGLLIATAVVPPVNFVVNYLWAFRRTTSSA